MPHRFVRRALLLQIPMSGGERVAYHRQIPSPAEHPDRLQRLDEKGFNAASGDSSGAGSGTTTTVACQMGMAAAQLKTVLPTLRVRPPTKQGKEWRRVSCQRHLGCHGQLVFPFFSEFQSSWVI